MSRRSDIIEANVRGGGITKRVCPVVSLLRSQTIEVSFVDSRVWQDRVHFRERLLTTIPQRGFNRAELLLSRTPTTPLPS